MRRGRTLIFVFLIIIIAGVVAFVAYNQYLKPAPVVEPASVEVYIAAQPIPQGGTITSDLLATIKIVQGQNLEVMYTLDEQPLLVGKISKYPLEQGVIITSSMVGDSATDVSLPGPTWATTVPAGMTAMSIPANRFSLSGYAINTGARVNLNACFLFVDVDPMFQSMLPNLTATLIGTGPGKVTGPDGTTAEGLLISLSSAAGGSDQGRLELDPSLQQPYYILPFEAQRPRMVCQMLLQDVLVMKTGDFSLEAGATIDTPSVPEAPPPAEGETAVQPTIAAPDIVTLIVNPQDSITLTYLLNIQQSKTMQTLLSLTLRNPTDHARQATEAATLQFLLSQYNIPVPAKLPYALQPALSGLLPLDEPVVVEPAP
jgi:pilus assembly protein CpaB